MPRPRPAADDEDDFRPRRRAARDDDRSYKNSPVRYVILGILLMVLAVMGFLLYQKRQREAQDAGAPRPAVGHV